MRATNRAWARRKLQRHRNELQSRRVAIQVYIPIATLLNAPRQPHFAQDISPAFIPLRVFPKERRNLLRQQRNSLGHFAMEGGKSKHRGKFPLSTQNRKDEVAYNRIHIHAITVLGVKGEKEGRRRDRSRDSSFPGGQTQ